ncbi:MAG: hypothetical protein K1X91_15445 [Bacteriodetes bacterium]|nr:hypothetical protein [Bacteroidota bacterium]
MLKLLFLLILTLSVFKCNIIAQWKTSNGPTGFNIYDLVKLNNKLYVATEFGGIQASINDGDEWHVISDAKTNSLIQFTSSLYGFNNNLYLITMGNKILSSSDGGVNWVNINYNLTNQIIHCLVQKDSVLIIGTNNGVYKKNTYSTIWEKSTDGLQNSNITQMIKVDTTLIAISNNHLFSSSMSNLNWQQQSTIETKGKLSSVHLCFNKLLLITDSLVFWKYIDSTRWQPCNITLKGDNIVSIEVSNNLVYAGSNSGKIYKSLDSGTMWQGYLTDNKIDKINKIISSDIGIYIATSKGVFKVNTSTNTLSEMNKGLSNSPVYMLYNNNSNIVAGTFISGLFTKTSDQKIWKKDFGILDNKTCIALEKLDNKYLIGTNDGLYESTDFITFFKIPLPVLQPAVYCIKQVQETIYVGTSSGLYFSKDNGINWENSIVGTKNQNINSLYAVDTMLYACTNSGVYKTSKNSLDWVSVNTGLNNKFTRTIISANSVLYVGTNDGVYESKNRGDTWNRLDSINLNGAIYTVIEVSNTLLFASSKYGVIKYEPLTGKLSTENNGLPIFDTRCFTQDSNTIYVGTNGYGVWEIDIHNFLASINVNDNYKSQYKSNKVNIKYISDKSVEMQIDGLTSTIDDISIYTINGKLIHSSQNVMLESNTYRFQLNDNKLTSGIYVIVISVGKIKYSYLFSNE